MHEEPLQNYEQEKAWLTAPYHKTIAFIDNKCITVSEQGEYHFYYITDTDSFVYGQDIEEEFLHGLHELSEQETELLETLKTVSDALAGVGVFAVSIRYDKKDEPFLIFCPEKDTEIFVKLRFSLYTQITADTVARVLRHKRARSTSPSKPLFLEV